MGYPLTRRLVLTGKCDSNSSLYILVDFPYLYRERTEILHPTPNSHFPLLLGEGVRMPGKGHM